MNNSSDSIIVSLFGDITDLVLAGFLWLLCSLPLITLGASSSALYYTVVKVIRRKRETVTKAFFFSFRQNLAQGCLVTVVYAVYALIIALFVIVTRENQNDLGSILTITALLILALPFVLTFFYICPVISRFQNKIYKQFLGALYLSLAHPFVTLLLLAWFFVNFSLFYVCNWIIAIIPGFYALVCSLLIERALKRHMKKMPNQYKDNEEKPWYLE